jgi:hypothetical protein
MGYFNRLFTKHGINRLVIKPDHRSITIWLQLVVLNSVLKSINMVIFFFTLVLLGWLLSVQI